MNSFMTALNAVFPMFCMLCLGVLLRRTGFLDKDTLEKMNRLCFRVFLACNIFYNICKTDITEVFDAWLFSFAVVSQFLVLALALIFSLPFRSEKKRRGALAHGIFHTNYVIFGTLIGTAICGEGNIGSLVLLVAVIVPLQNILSVVLLERFREGEHTSSLRKTCLSVLKNPYVIAALCGFLLQLLGIRLPDLLSGIFRDLGRCGSPVALIAMGGLFNFSSIKDNLRPIINGVLSRLLLVPALLIPLTVCLGFRGSAFVALMCIFIAPCATTSFNLASQMDSDADLASQLVVFTSVCSLFTIFLWIYGLSRLGLF